MVRFVLYGGKGGVGKTTCASATALSLAEEGYKTLVVSTDPAHSIADVFEREVTTEPQQILDDSPVHAVEVDPKTRLGDRYEETVQKLLSRAQMLGFNIDETDVEDVTNEGMIPGSDELAVLDMFAEYMSDERWDVVVFDTAPTGHTLRLLRLPDVAGTVLGKASRLRNQVTSVASKVTNIVPGNDEEDKKEENIDIGNAQTMVDRVAEVLQDEDLTEFRVVTAPEEMALAETERLVAQLNNHNITVNEVIANKVLLDGGDECDFCQDRTSRQTNLITDAEHRLGLDIKVVPLMKNPTGPNHLRSVAEYIDTPEITEIDLESTSSPTKVPIKTED